MPDINFKISTKRMRDALRSAEEGAWRALETGKAPAWHMKRIRKEFVLPLIAAFEKRTGVKITVNECNGSSWVTCKGRHKDFIRDIWDACETVANSLIRADLYSRNDVRLANRFPELARLAWLAFEIDKLPGRPCMMG